MVGSSIMNLDGTRLESIVMVEVSPTKVSSPSDIDRKNKIERIAHRHNVILKKRLTKKNRNCYSKSSTRGSQKNHKCLTWRENWNKEQSCRFLYHLQAQQTRELSKLNIERGCNQDRRTKEHWSNCTSMQTSSEGKQEQGKRITARVSARNPRRDKIDYKVIQEWLDSPTTFSCPHIHTLSIFIFPMLMGHWTINTLLSPSSVISMILGQMLGLAQSHLDWFWYHVEMHLRSFVFWRIKKTFSWNGEKQNFNRTQGNHVFQ